MEQNKCNKTSELIQQKISGTLTTEEGILLEEHLSACALCRKQAVLIERTRLVLEKGKVGFSPDFTEKVMTAIYNEGKVSKAHGSQLPFFGFKWIPAAAVCLFLIINGVFVINKMMSSPKTVNVNFTFQLPGARTVSLVGEFNDWEPGANILTRQDGYWTIKLPLKPGRYQYAFVVDGSKWLPDPKAKELVDNGYGSKNSVIDTLKL